jgi:hypothetical protein
VSVQIARRGTLLGGAAARAQQAAMPVIMTAGLIPDYFSKWQREKRKWRNNIRW